MSQNRRNRRNQARNIKNGKARFIGLEFNLDHIPKEELKTLKIGTSFNGKNLEAVIETSERTIETHSVMGYRKESKPGFTLKKTNFISNSSKMGVLSNLGNFDVILGVDTNSKIIDDQKINIGVAAEIIIEDKNIFFEVINVFDSIGEVYKPENQNWKKLIQFIQSRKDFSNNLNYAIIVDSDLENIAEFNQRTKAIIDDFYLPQNFKLIYASSDASNDEITNQLITFCDKIAKLAFEKIK